MPNIDGSTAIRAASIHIVKPCGDPSECKRGFRLGLLVFPVCPRSALPELRVHQLIAEVAHREGNFSQIMSLTAQSTDHRYNADAEFG